MNLMMLSIDLRLWMIFASFVYAINGVNINEITNTCKRNDPNLDECATKAANELRKHLEKGIKSLRIQPLDPMFIPKIQITSGEGRPVAIDVMFTDVNIKGLSGYEVKKVHIDLDKREISAQAFVPLLSTRAKYNVNGRVLTLPITGNGHSRSNYTGVTSYLTLKMKPEIKEGKEFWALEESDFDLEVQRAHIMLDNLFNGNKQLGDTMNAFINENWSVVFSELKPTVRDAVNTVIKDLATKLFKNVPVDELFPQ